MGAQAARGFAWMLGQTFGSKIFSFFTQIVLARILSRSDFGLVALAYTAVAFAGVIRQTGIQQILVQRHANFRRWVNPAFWFEFSVGIATALLLAVASPVAAVVFHSNALTGLILVIAAAAPLSPWFVVPTARLTIDMRFKAIAAVNITYNFIAMAMSIFLAWRGFGAYSFVIPLPIAGVIRAFWLWRLAKPHINPNPQFRRWKFLLGDSGLLLATGFFNSVMYQFGSLVLGLTYPKAVVGQFFLAFNLSTQMSQLLSQNVLTVLLPAFSWMQNQTRRHAAAFLYASRMLAFISIPLCLVMAVIAKPLILLLYGAKWSPAVPVLQALALAAVAYVPSSPAITAMQSQGRFRELFRWTMLQTVAYTVAICIGASAAGATGVALAILAYSIATSPVMIRIALHEGYHWREIIRVYFGPVATGTIAFAPLSGAFILWPELLHRYTLWLGLGIVTPALAFPFAARIFCPSEFRGVWGQVATLAYRGRLGSLSRRPPQK
jgi:O-antigen/teichoic acid export membrane protein